MPEANHTRQSDHESIDAASDMMVDRLNRMLWFEAVCGEIAASFNGRTIDVGVTNATLERMWSERASPLKTAEALVMCGAVKQKTQDIAKENP